MTFVSAWKVCCTSAATEIRSIAATGERPARLVVQVGVGTVWLGGSAAVTSSDGLALTTSHARPTEIELWQGDALYGLGSSSSVMLECLARY